MASHIVTEEEDGSITIRLNDRIQFKLLYRPSLTSDILNFLNKIKPLEFRCPTTDFMFELMIKMYLDNKFIKIEINAIEIKQIIEESWPISTSKAQQMIAEFDAIVAKDPNLPMIKGTSD